MKNSPIRYAVVGLGDIAQEAVLPAFKRCRNSELTALVSGDVKKRDRLGLKYKVKNAFSYEEYTDCLKSGLIDAVYIALPNHLHREYTVRAAESKIHVLCEKPMAVTESECLAMNRVCRENDVKLMIAYRLHFEKANLEAIRFIHQKKKIGDPRMFQSIHSQAAKAPNIRILPISKGGGPTYDMGIYDINAARYLFKDEPISVFAEAIIGSRKPFMDTEETMSVVLRFPQDRLASLIYSFGTVKTDTFRMVGSKGEISLDPAYNYVGGKTMRLSDGENKKIIKFKSSDHFAAEIDYFSECILKNRTPEPSGEEGLVDIQIIQAIFESVKTRRPVALKLKKKELAVSPNQEIFRPALRVVPKLVDAENPSKEKAS